MNPPQLIINETHVRVNLTQWHIDTFWERVNKASPDKCWPWTGGKSTRGYGLLSVFNKNTRTHRISWQLHFGDIPLGLIVCHRCDNPPCCNPSHLFLGTENDNAQDRKRKGRGRVAVGEKSNFSKLTAEDVREIRRLRAGGAKIKDLKEMFGIGKGIEHILYGNTWKHVTESLPPLPNMHGRNQYIP